jgi:uncharacterized OB-fold protein
MGKDCFGGNFEEKLIATNCKKCGADIYYKVNCCPEHDGHMKMCDKCMTELYPLIP